ncbi:SWIB-domain-containing protein [Aaosphaeria arxii CBS 175.79]|uniref:SWIB-domain-containing protein n=1 Tax=Aaosphaeria arxii CBS 175.79 TaxID=1450172 RepID=A0A6A5XT46_9PLEO|nr:SWIB-domain-containing protein [Aaosphaeria arxii CBS 175.79]KAF2015987.1 SWIB-domain-containing protein [Aaosphaeria arxii CBS 175.79]
MAPLPQEVEASYAAIIDSILAASDLTTISAKRVRKGLQERVDYDISHQKDAVNALIMTRFDKVNFERNGGANPAEPVPTVETNGAAESNGSVSKKRTPDDDSQLDERQQSPPKKKQKQAKSAEDEDAKYAAKLQAEFNAASRARSTRGGNTKKKAPVVKKKGEKKKKKSANKVKDEDDSDIDSGSGAEKKEVKRTGGFHKAMVLSPPLSELLGETVLSRPQTVKKIWEYVKARDLQDPNDKRQIRCDDAMRAVFKQDRVHMFTMNKILNQNLYAQDE